MKTINTVANFATKFLCVAIFSLLAVACSEEIISESYNGQDLVQTHDYDGYSIGNITNQNGHFSLGLEIRLAKERIRVPAEMLGRIDNVAQTNPIVTAITKDNQSGEQMDRDFTFSPDSQTAHALSQWLADSLATYHYELTNVYYVDYEAEPIDDEGNIYKMTPHFAATYRHTSDASLNGTLNLYPRYYQIKEGVEVIDSLIITTHNYEGHADGNVTNVLGTGHADITVTLGKNSVEVDKALLGQLTLTNESTPSTSDISTSSETGSRSTKNFTFSDTQTAAAIYQYLYQKAAENHVEITGVTYVNYTSEAINSESVWIIPHFNVTYRRIGSETATGSFDLYPKYKQVAKAIVPDTYTYDVTTKFTDDEANSVKTKMMTLTVTKKNQNGDVVQTWRCRRGVVISGHVSGYPMFVKNTTVTKKVYNDEESMDAEYHYTRPIEGNEQFVETKTTHLWRYQNHFTADAGGDIYTDSHLMFQSVVITFTDGEYTYTSPSFVKSAEVTYDNIDQDNSLIGKTKTENGKNYVYGGTHRLTVKNILDGEDFFSSTASSELWVLQ
jgi:hypothetical protein